MQRNFGIKALVLAQQHDLRQLHFYQVGEATDAPPAGTAVSGEEEFKLMGLYENLSHTSPGHQRITQLGQALQTTSRLLRGLPYAASATKSLRLPDNVAGGAFTDGRRTVYVLWAKTQEDQSEAATANYSFPPELRVGKVIAHDWNAAPGSNTPAPHPAQGLVLTGTPTFFVAASTSATASAPQDISTTKKYLLSNTDRH
jgi:hypothetical protein